MATKLLKISLITSLALHLFTALTFHVAPYFFTQDWVKKAAPVGVNVVYVPAPAKPRSEQKTVSQSKPEKKLKNKRRKVLKKITEPLNSNVPKHAFKAKKFGHKDGIRLNQEQEYIYKLREHIVKYLEYPRAAVKLRQTGEVIIKVDIHRTGKIINAKIEKSCPFTRLNDAALKLVRSVGNFSPFPTQLSAKVIQVSVPVGYRAL